MRSDAGQRLIEDLLANFPAGGIPTFWVEGTGRMTPFVGGISWPIYRRLDSSFELEELPPGALYCASEPWCTGFDGQSVVCVLPCGSHWHIDSEASNCTRKGDLSHRCWVRHGGKGRIVHVDKEGPTCSAGAGSIQTRRWHGFLHNGRLSLS